MVFKRIGFLICFCFNTLLFGQTIIDIYPDSLQGLVNKNYQPGVFYVPKTEGAVIDFNTNDIHQNAIRTNVIESAINSVANLEDAITLLETVEEDLVGLSDKTDKLIFIFEKMPAWLSSSSDGSPAGTPGWYVLNTKKPADWDEWQTVVETITDKIVNGFEIENAYFEVWNEPDIGSWTGSMDEYFELYKRTYDGIKAVNISIKVGGPAVNYWANNIYWKPIPGYVNNAHADSSLISKLLDYSTAADRIPDFMSWHNFSINYQEYGVAASYLNYKCGVLGIDTLEVILSEWNAPSVIRDTPLAKTYMIKSQYEISKTTIGNNVIAAWQDFSFSTDEFHNDYGLITYGGIHKPAYNAVLLSNKLKGEICKTVSTDPSLVIASIYDYDSLFILIANYCPPPFQEAINKTLYEGKFNANDLDTAGYINLAENDFSYLLSIYQEVNTIPSSSPLNEAINNAIPTYHFYDSLATNPRTYQVNVSYYDGTYYDGDFYLLNDQTNNLHYKYDSLRIAGFNQEEATLEILTDQNLQKTITAFSTTLTITLEPNAIILYKLNIEEPWGINEKQLEATNFIVYPNPANKELILETNLDENTIFHIYNLQGKRVKTIPINSQYKEIDISQLNKGIYLIGYSNDRSQYIKFVKN